MEALADILLPLAEKYGPTLIDDIGKAFEAKGYTIAQVEEIFSNLKSYNQLGINPNAPVQPEPPAAG